jgi:hypothetical protein
MDNTTENLDKTQTRDQMAKIAVEAAKSQLSR